MTDYRNLACQQILAVQVTNSQQKEDCINKLQLQKLKFIHNFSNSSKQQIQEIADQLSSSKSLEQFNQTQDTEHQIFIEKSQRLLREFIQLDQIRSKNLRESNNTGFSQLKISKKHKKCLVLLFLVIILSCVAFICFQLLSQTEREIKETERDIHIKTRNQNKKEQVLGYCIQQRGINYDY
ncbi:unnamed protein product [Paramecium sonneborni]|uniref:Transmembrane protein n=1 Tax=Paramecium sonneborni TaxID=65129 RepID=A0A8S1RTH1_9CILI|nr:unnamed protein product [Paramecium sonneborni]